MKKLTCLLLSVAMCFVLGVPAFAEQTEHEVSLYDYSIQQFRVQEVRAYPSYFNQEDGKYHYYTNIYRNQINRTQYNWLELIPATTQKLLNQFAAQGNVATHWYLKVTCYAENIPNIDRYEYRALKDGNGQVFQTRGFNGTQTFYFAFPVQNTSERYYNGIDGGLYYDAGYGETSFGLTGALALNSTFSSAI